ncbi:phage tail sheath subtilisin-like domain-containing protein [Paraburkholderia sp. MM5477-R1]|uniref:phage tail sheath family protein n=1 Tax=Paraburkholderia sp. MM5477-R1 TaxID=2991062 RepID=UPI003D1EC063
MSDTNYLSPGVYIQELEGPAPIVGVSTSIAAFIGMAERGPVNVPILCSSQGDYTRAFGGLMVPDEFADPVDLKRFHCYLPYSVAGFFNNQGQLAYVIRVLPDEATAAFESLYDRSGISPNDSILVRNAAVGDGTGNSAATGALIMLDPTPPKSVAGTPSFIRVGSGSDSEYLQVTGVSALGDAYPLDLPLQLSHSAGANFLIYPRAVEASGASYSLAGDAAAGDTVILLSSTATVAILSASLLEFAANGVAVVVVPAPTGVTQTGPTTFTITLTQPLTLSFSSATGATSVTALTPNTTPAPANQLDVAASGGDLIVYATGAGLTYGDFIDVEPTTPANREVRTIGLLTKLEFVQPSTIDLPPMTQLAQVQAVANSLSATPATNPGTLTLALTSRVGIYAGSTLSIGPSGSQETVTVQNVVLPHVPGLDGGNVTLTSATKTPHNSGDPVTIVSTLSGAALSASTLLSLTGRVGIDSGSVLLIGTAPAQEYAVVAAVQGTRAVGADPGPVALEAPLVNGYIKNASVALVSFTVQPAALPPGPGTNRATQLLLDTPAGSSVAYTTWSAGWNGGDTVQITLSDGTIVYNTVGSTTAPQKLSAITVAPPLQRTHQAGSPVVSRSPLIEVQALDRGAWGRRVALAVQDESPGLVSSTQVAALIGPTQLKLSSLTGIQPGSYLELLNPDGTLVDASAPLKVASVNLATTTITLDTALSGLQQTAINAPGSQITIRSREFRLTVYLYRHPDPAVPSRNSQVILTETFRNLSMDSRSALYFQSVIGAIDGPLRLSDRRPEGSSSLIRVQDTATTQAQLWSPRLGPEPLVDVLPNGLIKPAQHKLDIGGDDSLATVDDSMYIGADAVEPADRTGIYAIRNAPQVSLVAIPGQGSPAIQAKLIDFCETLASIFAVLDPQYPDAAIADIQAQRQAFDTKYAAIYYPWLTIPSPMPSNLSVVPDFPLPPSGYVVGIYARVDVARGVFKAPANEVVQGITGLTRTVTAGDQDVLNPAPFNINAIRDFRPQGRGIRVWGARVITSDDNYKYVPVRRLLIFIEQSLIVGLQDVVFEPNTPQLWATMERLIDNFLYTVFTSGAFAGATPETSYFVRCDQTTMTPDDIDAGRLIALVGVAPAKPAEFVIIQIALTVATSSQ